MILNRCLFRLGKATKPCCRKIVKEIQTINIDDKAYSIPCLRNQWPVKLCTGKYLRPEQNIMWTQVRFCQKSCSPPKCACPTTRLHRDIEFPSYDAYRKKEFIDVCKTSWRSGDEKPGYTYILGVFGIICGFYGTKAHLIHYVLFMAATAEVIAMATIEFDLSHIKPGVCLTIKWRGKPLFIRNRTQQEIDLEARTPLSSLRDPEEESQRVQRPQWLVIIGICTHLGCCPLPDMGDFLGGFYCPCHGAQYDNLGRVRRGPAPLNMAVPPYSFITDTLIRIG